MSGRALVLLSLALVVPSSLASVSDAYAQSPLSPAGPTPPAATVTPPPPPPPGRMPERCGMTDETAEYGVEVGAVVTLQRHRMVRGEDNWDPRMEGFIGRAAHVTRLSGTEDHTGCPVVNVDVDGGRYFWRVRDLGLGTGMQPLPAVVEGSDAFPQSCHQQVANYGAATIGASVVLGRHRAVDGDTNWAEDMAQFVGRSAHVASYGDLDTEGCPGVRVDIDGQQWFWRVRDLRPAGDTSVYETFSAADEIASTPSLGVTTDHGRPPSVGTGIFGTGGVPGPQACGLTEAQVVWDPIALGAQVILGRHRAVGVMPDGVTPDDNWDSQMDQYVGVSARVTQLAGVDDQGCPSVRVDVDGGNFVWRVRDMSVTSGGTTGTAPGWSGIMTWPSDCGQTVASYGPVVVGSRIVLGAHTPWSGPDPTNPGQPVVQDADWNDEMMQFVGSTATVTQLDGVDLPAGCSGVRVDVDGGQWFWRLRDAHPAP